MADEEKIMMSLIMMVFMMGIVMQMLEGLQPPGPPQPQPGLANLYGSVVDASTGQAIADVLVDLNGHQTYTTAAGYFELLNLSLGSYTVTFSKDGYQTEVL